MSTAAPQAAKTNFGGLSDQDRIFQNIYGFHDTSLKVGSISSRRSRADQRGLGEPWYAHWGCCVWEGSQFRTEAFKTLQPGSWGSAAAVVALLVLDVPGCLARSWVVFLFV